MAKRIKSIQPKAKRTAKRRAKKPVDAYADLTPLGTVKTLSQYIDLLYPYSSGGDVSRFWYRGHGCLSYKLAPSALRPDDVDLRKRRLDRLDQFIRLAAIRHPAPPSLEDRIDWMQIAQHYGLYTRLLDWSTSAAVGAYFACDEHEDRDGVVFLMQPEHLNSDWYGGEPRTLSPQHDRDLLKKFERLDATASKHGEKDVAVELSLNNARVAAQRGAFTLHGNRHAHITAEHNRTLARVIISGDAKGEIRRQLAALGIDQIALFPELERLCDYLKELDRE